jgi:acid phosphatase family membrane protein YuiD
MGRHTTRCVHLDLDGLRGGCYDRILILSIDYLFTPFLAWLITGCCKFLLNSIVQRRLAFDLIGYGGFPSNHAAISTSIVFLIGLKEGIDHPAFGVAVAFAFIVLLDASSLRREVGEHSVALNKLVNSQFRERMGHSKFELAGGVIIGLLTAILVFNSGFVF